MPLVLSDMMSIIADPTINNTWPGFKKNGKPGRIKYASRYSLIYSDSVH